MVRNCKNDFPIFEHHPGLAYLDSAATAQVPRAVLDATGSFDEKSRANIHRGIYTLSEHATNLYERARAQAASFIDAEVNEIIFTAGTTDSMNKLAHMLEYSPEVGAGSEIVTTIMEHHSALLPFGEFARRKGYTLSRIPVTEKFDLDMEKAHSYITKETRLVIVSLASNVLGTVNDVRAIAERAHEMGALIIVDAAQAIGHVPVSVKDLGCDFLAFSGHKMCGPMGIGVLFGRSEFLSSLYPGSFGGGMVADVSEAETIFVDPPYRFEDGTRNVSGAVGLGEAVTYLNSLGVDTVHMHTQELVGYAIDRLEEIPGITLWTQKNVARNAGIVSFTLEGIHPHDIAEICAREDVAVRAGHQCALPLMKEFGVPGVIRASMYVYSEKEDIDRLVEAIKKVQTIFL